MSTDNKRESLRIVLARMALNNPLVSTQEAVEAQRVLQSIKDTKPTRIDTAIEFHNTEVDTRVQLNRQRALGSTGATDISFKTDGGFERPDTPNTRVRRLGVNATVNQAIDSLPTARDGTGRSAYYEATPMLSLIHI